MDLRNQGEQPATPAAHAHGGPNFKGGMVVRTLAVLLTVLVICMLAVFALRVVEKFTGDSSVKGKQFQALFLSNGQVYFGHLSDINDNYVKLTDIYYLQVQQAVQPSSSSSSSSSSAAQSVSLTKLGNELHGPEDVMYVSHSQVLFWENLKNSGKVVTAITAAEK